jgi:hypothetical protein
MKTIQSTLDLPLDTCKDVALKIISLLPAEEFCDIAEEIQLQARKRSFEALEQMRLSAQRGGLRKQDFTEALKVVRARKQKSKAARRS